MSVRKLRWAFLLTLITILGIVFILSCVYAQTVRRSEEMGKPPKLEAKLIMYKKEYLLREPIWIKVQVTNVGEKPGKFSFITHEGLVIKDSKGKGYPCNLTWESNPVTIEPKETFEEQLELLIEYGLPEDSFHVRWYLPSEKYTVFYSLRKDLKSEVCTFQVSTPEGDELKAMNFLKESHDLFIQKRYNESISKLNRIIQEYPKSRYVPYALFKLSGIYKIALEDFDKALEIYRKIINDFPNSGEAISRLSSVIYYYNTKPDKPGLINYLNDLMKKHPNTEVAKEAQKELAKIRE
jgi:tetratricopeptide (TPR) repeat protein